MQKKYIWVKKDTPYFERQSDLLRKTNISSPIGQHIIYVQIIEYKDIIYFPLDPA